MSGLIGAGDVEAVCIWGWVFPNAATRAAAARNVIEKDSRLQLFDEHEAPALLAIAWERRAACPQRREGLVRRCATDRRVAREAPGCLVVVRQPLKAQDPAARRDWVSTVLLTLDGDATPPEGLLTANFFAGRDGASVYNLAAAMVRMAASDSQTSGAPPASTPRAEHEVRRYARHGALVSA